MTSMTPIQLARHHASSVSSRLLDDVLRGLSAHSVSTAKSRTSLSNPATIVVADAAKMSYAYHAPQNAIGHIFSSCLH
jgi:hypothetical protein